MPERLDLFMARANVAYYASRDPFADFTTAMPHVEACETPCKRGQAGVGPVEPSNVCMK